MNRLCAVTVQLDFVLLLIVLVAGKVQGLRADRVKNRWYGGWVLPSPLGNMRKTYPAFFGKDYLGSFGP